MQDYLDFIKSRFSERRDVKTTRFYGLKYAFLIYKNVCFMILSFQIMEYFNYC